MVVFTCSLSITIVVLDHVYIYILACIGMVYVYVQYTEQQTHTISDCMRASLPSRPSPLVNGLGGGGGENTGNWEKLD